MNLSETEKIQIGRINEISLMARTTWFGLLAYLAFVGVTLMGVEDADFFVPTRQTQLPLIGVQIPTASFFWFAPILGLALYAYLHLQLIKLWDALGAAPVRPGHRPLSAHVYPWLINDLALSLRKSASRPLPLRWMAIAVSGLLVWIAGPVVLGGFWVRSMPAHNDGMTHLIGACLVIALAIGVTSAWCLIARSSTHHTNSDPWRNFWLWVGTLLAAGLVIVQTDIRTQGRFIHQRHVALVEADLKKVEFVSLKEAILDYGVHRRRYRIDWCKRNELPIAVCGPSFPKDSEPALDKDGARARFCQNRSVTASDCDLYFATIEDEFKSAWIDERNLRLAEIDGLDMSGKDLRGADMSETILARSNFSLARMERVNLVDAVMEGTNLSGAEMKRANIRGARMENAVLVGTQLNGANLSRVLLEGADLSRAKLENATLFRANLRQVNLFDAYMDGANLFDASLEGANLFGARMNGTILRGAQMDATYLFKAELNGANLYKVRMEKADLSRAQMEGANLTAAFLADTNLNGANLKSANVQSWNIARASLRSVDFSGAYNLDQLSVNSAYGDVNTALPDFLLRPCHWASRLETRDLPTVLRDGLASDKPYQAWLAAGGLPGAPPDAPGTCFEPP